MLRGWIRTDMTRTEAILNGQQIHTSPPFEPDSKHVFQERRQRTTRMFTEKTLKN
jgi:hypothetical protein